jgi:hypothetical protein
MQIKIRFWMAVIALSSLAACSLPLAGPAAGDTVGTAVAQTLNAQTGVAQIVAATLGALVTDTPVSTPVPSLTPLPTFTATLPVPLISVSVNTNCRTGPGKAYDMVGALAVGQTAEILGRDGIGQYWLIRDPKNPTNICWLWGYYATVSGDTSRLPVATPPPTPTPAPGFSVVYLNTTVCGGQYGFRFKIANTGPLTWESIKIFITDTTTASTFTHTRDSFKDFNGCAANGEQLDLAPGENGAVAAVSPGQMIYNPAGHTVSAAVTLCSANALAGTCVTQTVNFTP